MRSVYLERPTHTDPMTDAVFTLVFIARSIGFTCLGVLLVRHPKAVAEFFRATGSRMFGRTVAERVYTEGRTRFTGWMFVVVGPLFVAFGVWAAITAFHRLA